MPSVSNGMGQELAAAQREAAIASIESFLNDLQSYEAEFEQTAYDNSKRKGKLYVLKPNRVRVEYTEPDTEILLVDDEFITHYMKDIDEVNFMPNDGIPISILSKPSINLHKDLKILSVREFNNQIELIAEVIYQDQKNILSLTFHKHPFDIAKISLLDEDNNKISMRFVMTQKNLSLNPSLFEIGAKSTEN